MNDEEILTANIHKAAGELTGHLSDAIVALTQASWDVKALMGYGAIEYLEGRDGADINRHLDDAARFLRAAWAINWLAARNTVECTR